MFSQTIFINHLAGDSPLVTSNGEHQDQASQETCLSGQSSVNTRRESVRSYYKSHRVERFYSDKSRTRERQVNCFVRSEIKWVFLRSLKVQCLI